MKALFKNLIVGGLFIIAVASPIMTVATPQPAFAAVNCSPTFLGIPAWYRGLAKPVSVNGVETCEMISPTELDNGEPGSGMGKYVWRIVLNVIQMAVSALALVAVLMIIYGGFLYLTGGALPAQLEKAKKTIFNSVIGLVICLAAGALTNLVFSIIT